MFYNLSKMIDKYSIIDTGTYCASKDGLRTSEEITGDLADDGAFVRAFAILKI